MSIIFPGPIAVIDVETTGLFPLRNDRVIEIAAVVVGQSGTIENEFVSLVNPTRDVGPTRIHDVTASDVAKAPSFRDIASPLIACLQGSVAIAAHNIAFDEQFLKREFARIDCIIPKFPTICTLQFASGANLQNACDYFGVDASDSPHSALSDARATARLLVAMIQNHDINLGELVGLPPICWPAVLHSNRRPLTRQESRKQQQEPPDFLQRLASLRPLRQPDIADGSIVAYSALLDRVLEDRKIDREEGEALVEAATSWGLSAAQIEHTHLDYLHQLSRAAVADGEMTEIEHEDLRRVGRLLGQDLGQLDSVVKDAAEKIREIRKFSSASRESNVPSDKFLGKRVCFTGDSVCLVRGERLSRRMAERLAADAGMQVMNSVTKKLDILVVVDPDTQSGKARKAHEYGIRVMHEPVFWTALGITVE